MPYDIGGSAVRFLYGEEGRGAGAPLDVEDGTDVDFTLPGRGGRSARTYSYTVEYTPDYDGGCA